MMNKLKIFIFTAVLFFISGSTYANINDQSNDESAPSNLGYYPCQCNPNIPCLSMERDIDTEVWEAEQAQENLAPIFIGGFRYTIAKSDFVPTYEWTWIMDPCGGRHISIRKLVGYKVSLKAEGDEGQPLIFDIIGNADQPINLSVSCGTFSGADAGKKIIISKHKTTNGSCTSMELDATWEGRPPSSLDMTIMVSNKI